MAEFEVLFLKTLDLLTLLFQYVMYLDSPVLIYQKCNLLLWELALIMQFAYYLEHQHGDDHAHKNITVRHNKKFVLIRVGVAAALPNC